MCNVYGLTIDQLVFSFAQQEQPLFDGLVATFERNKVHFIVGKNGSGKSTLFRILRGFCTESDKVAGVVTVNGAVINLGDRTQAAKRLMRVRLVDQKFDQMLVDQYNFIDNLRFARLASMPTVTPLSLHKPLPDFLDRFAIDSTTPVRLLSGGQRQILAILMALQQSVDVLLLDEPTAALDEKNAIMLMDFIHQLAVEQGVTVLIICHDQSLVDRYAAGAYHKLCHHSNSLIRQLVRANTTA